MVNKRDFKRMLEIKTGCKIQYNGWCCGTCFFAIANRLTNADWQSLLFYRGDATREELKNLPENYKDNIKMIWELIK